MRITSIGQFAAPQIVDESTSDEVAELGLSQGDDSPVDSISETPEEPHEDQHETKEGLIRLMDFIRRKQNVKRGHSKVENAIAGYQQLDSTEERMFVRGQNISKKA